MLCQYITPYRDKRWGYEHNGCVAEYEKIEDSNSLALCTDYVLGIESPDYALQTSGQHASNTSRMLNRYSPRFSGRRIG
jgi:hypothetical protein